MYAGIHIILFIYVNYLSTTFICATGGLFLLLFIVAAVTLTVVSVLLCKSKSHRFSLKNSAGIFK